MESRKSLVAKRGMIKAQVTRMNTFFDQNERIKVADAQVRLCKLNELWEHFNKVQALIEYSKQEEENANPDALQEEFDAERQIFESSYFRAAAIASDIIEKSQAQEQQNQSQSNDQRTTPSIEHRIDVKLPTLKLPEFVGEYEKWLPYKDVFESLIHKNERLSTNQKFQYLKSTLQGEAAQTIAGLQTTGENYENAWELLKNSYDNSKIIINTHLSQLLDLPVITKEKHTSLKQLAIHMRTHTKALEALKQPIQHWDTILIHLAKARLDFNTQRDWEEENNSKPVTEMPTLNNFLQFIEERSRTYELIEKNRRLEFQKMSRGKKPEKKIMLATTATAQNCIICKQKHPFYLCKKFLEMSIEDRVNEVKEKKACLNCLGTGHYAQICKASTCKKCSKPHNTLLHFERKHEETAARNSAGEGNQTAAIVMETEQEEEPCTATVCSARQAKSQVMLATVQVLVKDSQGKHHECRALLDAGSQLNLITQEVVQRLKRKCEHERQIMSGISQAKLSTNQTTEINMQSMSSNFTAILKCQILPVITERLPQFAIDKDSVEVPEGIQLADPTFWKPGKIDLLIGASLFWTLMCNGQIVQRRGIPALQNTQLGWILGGEIVNARANQPNPICLHITNEELHKQLGSFFEREEVTRRRRYTKQELECENQFEKTTKQDETVRFTVTLPKDNDIVLGKSWMQASKRLASMKRRFKNQPLLQKEYTEFMEDYERRGHMTPIKEEEDAPDETYVIPQQAVEKPESLTTQLRVVFHASCKTSSGFSLNDKLLPGPNLQGDLFNIICRFRTRRFVVTADVEKMYRQILVDEKDRDLQRILWRSDTTKPVEVYRLNTERPVPHTWL